MRWYIGVLLLLLAALFLEAGLLAYAMYVLLGLLLLTRFLAKSWVGKLKAKRDEVRHVAEIGERVRMTLTVTNEGRLPVPWVILEDLLPGGVVKAGRVKIKGKRMRVCMLSAGGETKLEYTVECVMRGYYQLGPLLIESGDLFGLHRRYRVDTVPHFLLVYPKIIPMSGYDVASKRPIGDVRLTHRLYEDPTRIAGVREYEAGDPLNRVHWRATARTGTLHCKMYEPSTLAGATLLLDFHRAGYPKRGEPHRSELAVTAVASLAHALYLINQQVGLVCNGRDAADRIRLEGWDREYRTRTGARQTATMQEESQRLQPLVVETRRGIEQFERIRETLARVELTDGFTVPELIEETAPRMPRNATLLAVLPDVSIETALALGNLKRRGFAVTVVMIQLDPNHYDRCAGRLMSEGIRDVRHLRSEAALPDLCSRQILGGAASMEMEETAADAPPEEPMPDWAKRSRYELGSAED